MTIAELHKIFIKSTGVCTDTRKLKNNQLFFALKGDNFDGNFYAQQAIDQEALYAIVDDKSIVNNSKIIYVDNVLDTLQKLATYHRVYLDIKIIALTGSNGKTTTKELINEVLKTTFNTVATQGNLNNHIGVPLTLLSMTKSTEIGVVEMGANHINEIEFLCNIARPNFGYITNIGKAHLEGFGSLDGVLKGKTELYRHLQKEEELVFLNAEDEKLVSAAITNKSFKFSENNNTDTTIKFVQANPMVAVSYKNSTIQSNLIGSYNFTNIAAAIAIGDYFKIPPQKIKKAIESYTPNNNRSEIVILKNYSVIMDAYNANPSSISAAIENFKISPYRSKTIFLGDMFELGPYSAKEHEKIVEILINTDIDQIILIGQHFYKTKITNSNIIKYTSFSELEDNWSTSFLSKGNLIKGSRGMQLERILELIKKSE
ncbi:UDP-N-acetylmuramoyl-tripeptide--D-alanyl-D-alanine ligase [Aquimarina sp. W85]|uniref:UDP-N-acetylmuramoyl-tripeptide--D-alanyl-D- alanine ligase n=1 Tax=Aquimarina rhodophyticola TaxID=3342246 RepID=UPI00367285C4